MKKEPKKSMLYAILSLSLLTVMAGAAVAPALGTLMEHFASSGGTTVQLIISMPALFIFLASFIFPGLCRKRSHIRCRISHGGIRQRSRDPLHHSRSLS